MPFTGLNCPCEDLNQRVYDHTFDWRLKLLGRNLASLMVDLSQPQPEPGPVSHARRARPTLEQLFDHPLQVLDDDTSIQPLSGRAEFYEGWQADHLGRPRFYIKGSRRARTRLQAQDAKRYYAVAREALEIVKAETDWASYGGDWTPPAYNQFTRAFSNKPATLERVAVVIASMERVYSDSLITSGLQGNALDLYDLISIVPACYNIDDFTEDKLNAIRDMPNGITTLLRACSQRAPSLLKELATGHTVLRDTALQIRRAIKENFPSIEVGVVRPYPGSGGLGKKVAAPSEFVRLD